MNDLVVLVIIWIIIAAISKFFKKAKEEKPKAGPGGKQEKEIPPFLRQLLNLPEEKAETPEADFQEERSFEPEPAIEPGTETREQPAAVYQTVEARPVVAEPEIPRIHIPPRKKRRRILTDRQSLKQIYIWKEILDRPISLRRKNIFMHDLKSK
ncbi:MAG TPA: hypothetical protein ENK14_03640 [Caldithrix sp.]|nr:hypothetical protein [Caldithrix sp.]